MSNLIQGVGIDDLNWTCSNCKTEIYFEDDPDPSWWQYCPCCGEKIEIFIGFRELKEPFEEDEEDEFDIDEEELDEFIEMLKDIDNFEEC